MRLLVSAVAKVINNVNLKTLVSFLFSNCFCKKWKTQY